VEKNRKMNNRNTQLELNPDDSSGTGITGPSAFYDFIIEHIKKENRRTLYSDDFSMRIAERAVRLVFTGPELRSYFTAAFKHIECDAGRDFTLTVFCLEAGKKFMENAFSLIPGGYFSGNERDIPFLIRDGITIALGREGSTMSILNIRERNAVYLFADLAELPYYEQGSPFRNIFQWWFNGKESTMLHSGAVSLNGRALLISGRGGSGKSTISLSCLMNGKDYLGDDYVVVSDKKDITVSSLYNSVKLTRDSFKRFPGIQKLISNPGFSEDEKGVIFLRETSGGKVIPESLLKGIIIPEISGENDSSFKRISSAEGFRYLAPSTIFQHVGRRNDIAEFTGRLAKTLPCFKFYTGSDTASISKMVNAILQEI